jgi:hypothetical protein
MSSSETTAPPLIVIDSSSDDDHPATQAEPSQSLANITNELLEWLAGRRSPGDNITKGGITIVTGHNHFFRVVNTRDDSNHTFHGKRLCANYIRQVAWQ